MVSAGARVGQAGWNDFSMRAEVWRWLSKHARVRDALGQYDDLRLYDSALNSGGGSPVVVQLPAVAQEPWIGGRHGERVKTGRLSHVAFSTQPDPTRVVAGLVLDEWVDAIPKPTHTTGVAFHCDAPGATPPHAILIAVPPDDRSDWNVAGLEVVMRETMELLRVRMIGPRALGPAAQFLPATYLAYNPANETVSTDLLALSP
jgi:hypothetical protein